MATAVQQGIQAAAASNDMTQLKNTLTGLDAQLEASITSYSDSATKLTDAANSLVSAVGTDAGLNAVAGDLNNTIILMKSLRSAIAQVSTSVGSMTTDAAAAQKELDALVTKMVNSAATVQKDYEDNVKGALDDLADSVGNADSKVSSLLDSMDEGLDGVYKLSDSTESDLAKLERTLKTSGVILNKGRRGSHRSG